MNGSTQDELGNEPSRTGPDCADVVSVCEPYLCWICPPLEADYSAATVSSGMTEPMMPSDASGLGQTTETKSGDCQWKI